MSKAAISEKIERKQIEVDPAAVAAGNLMLVPYWVKVEKAYSRGDIIDVTNIDNNQQFQIRGRDLVKRCLSADQALETIELPRTKIAELLITLYNRPFTVCFIKDGTKEERILRGRLIEPETIFGRSKVEDLDKPQGDRFRLVDHRSLKWLIVEGVKYLSNSK